MGEVYRARDVKLNRDIALKVLPDLFALDRDRLARFKREAQLLASLNHPNIAAIYGVEEANPSPGSGQTAMRALVLELVEGPTLADRISHGPIPVREALPIARQIAEALEAAHEQGIIHRDLKPTNIKLRPDRTVKVLDFGLAKAMEPVGRASNISQSPTITTPGMTQAGTILGTAAYMSPEQARGHAVDKRTDIWAFGCVLYEMLSGRAAFAAETISDTIAKVLEREPNWQALPGATPLTIRRLLHHCLEKDSRQRLRDIGDVQFELQDAPPPEVPVSSPTGIAWRGRVNRWAAVAFVAIAAGTLGWYAANRNGPTTVAAGPTRFAVELPLAAPLFYRGLGNGIMALSPDGTHLAFLAGQFGQTPQLWLRALDRLDSQPIAGT